MVLTVIDVSGHVWMHCRWTYFKHCREVVTALKGRAVEFFRLKGGDGRGGATVVLETECKCGALVGVRGGGFSRLSGR
jgi:hypothetical protein